MDRSKIVAMFRDKKKDADKIEEPPGRKVVVKENKAAPIMGVDYPVPFQTGDGSEERTDKLNLISQRLFNLDVDNKTLQYMWNAQASAMTSDSFANEPYGVEAKIWVSNGDGSFSYYDSGEYSSLHYEMSAKDVVSQGVLDLEEEGERQISRVSGEGQSQVEAIQNEGAAQLYKVMEEGNKQISDVQTEGRIQINTALAEAMTSESFANEQENTFVKDWSYDPDTDTFSYVELQDVYSSKHWSLKAAQSASGLYYQGSWDSVDCSMPPPPSVEDNGHANGAFWIVKSVSGDSSSCPELTVGDWLIWEGDDPDTPDVEGDWQIINWTFDWSAITNIPDNVVNAITQTELDAGLAPKADITYVDSENDLQNQTISGLETDLSDHIAADNPHSITPEMIGAVTHAELEAGLAPKADEIYVNDKIDIINESKVSHNAGFTAVNAITCLTQAQYDNLDLKLDDVLYIIVE